MTERNGREEQIRGSKTNVICSVAFLLLREESAGKEGENVCDFFKYLVSNRTATNQSVHSSIQNPRTEDFRCSVHLSRLASVKF